MSHLYAQYSPNDFDNFDCLKISKGIYLIVLFVLRGYLVWLMSVTNMNDRVGVIQWIYPDPKIFYLSLFSGVVGLFVLLVLSLRRPEASKWVRVSWLNIREVLLAAMLFDLFINVLAIAFWQINLSSWLIFNVIVVFSCSTFLFTSKRVAININEFPEKLPEK